VPRIWDTNPLYLLIVALISTYFIVKNCEPVFIVKNCELPVLFIQARTNDSLIGPSQTPLSESFSTTLVLFAALVSFIGFEGLFFLAVSSSANDLGFFGPFHSFLWTLLESFNVGFVDVTRAVAGMLRGFVNAAEDQLNLNPVGDGESPVTSSKIVGEPEASPPPPY
jgi:hypothetical protein